MGDHLIRQAGPEKFYNPAGFYIHLVRENVAPPAAFETTRLKRLHEEANRARAQEVQERAKLELAYEEYQRREVAAYIARNYTEDECHALVEAKRQELLRQYKQMSDWGEDAIDKLAATSTHNEIIKQIALLTFDEFCAS